MKFIETKLQGAYIIEFTPFIDQRGVFTRLFCQEELAGIGFTKKIAQINHSLNVEKGTVRGLHFQNPPYSEIKIIRCLRGRVFDVMVDVRDNSPTFMQWIGIELSPQNYRAVYIPEGFAHGFQTLEENSELIYLHSEVYQPGVESGLRYDDPALMIEWPLKPMNVSQKDKSYAFI